MSNEECNAKEKVIKNYDENAHETILHPISLGIGDKNKDDADAISWRRRAWTKIFIDTINMDDTEKEMCLKSMAEKILVCDECRYFHLDDVLETSVVLDFSVDTIKWLLEQGANPNAISMDSLNPNLSTFYKNKKYTIMISASVCSPYIEFHPEIFYWLVVYGGEISVIPTHYKIDNDKIDKIDNDKIVNDCKSIIDRLESLHLEFGEEEKNEKENIFRTLTELKRGVNRMKSEVTLYCTILPPLLDICFAYLLWCHT